MDDRKEIVFCPHCGGPLIPSEIPDYVWQCIDCDEDFYGIEVVRKNIEKQENNP